MLCMGCHKCHFMAWLPLSCIVFYYCVAFDLILCCKLYEYEYEYESVSALESLLRACERELLFLDMIINAKKSCCMRIGPRCNVSCANIVTYQDQPLQWVF